MQNILLVVVSLLLSACAAQSTPSQKLMLSEGLYRLNGECISMMNHKVEEKDLCNKTMGISKKNSTQPEFLFTRQDGSAWVFKSSKSPKYYNNGDTGKYPVSLFLDTSEGRAYPLPGECIIDIAQEITVNCYIGFQKREKVKQVTFKGDGNWSFSKE